MLIKQKSCGKIALTKEHSLEKRPDTCGKECRAVSVFISYTHADELLKKELVQHLSLMRRNGEVSIWHDRDITGGREWQGEIDQHLEQAELILLLVSVDFIASEYCWDLEMRRALERHEAKSARVVPIIVRRVELTNAPFMKLQALPRNAEPVTSTFWSSHDEAWVDVVRGLQRAIADLMMIA
jgi:hypothetical protein